MLSFIDHLLFSLPKDKMDQYCLNVLDHLTDCTLTIKRILCLSLQHHGSFTGIDQNLLSYPVMVKQKIKASCSPDISVSRVILNIH